MSLFRKCTALSLLLALPLSTLALQRTDLLPQQGRSYVRISDTTSFWAALKKSAPGKLWADPQFQDFIQTPDTETLNALFFAGESQEENDVFMEQMKMLSGEIVFAYDLKKEDIYIIADMSRADFQRSLELDQQLRNVIENPFDIIKSTFQGIEIIEHVEHPGTDDASSSWHTHVGQTFLLGYSREWIEKSIVRLKKDEIKEPTGIPALTLNLPIKEIILKSFNGTAADRALFDALGLFSIENFNSTIELHETEMVINNNLSIEDLQKGLFTLFNTEPSELPTVTFIPENIASLQVGRLDLFRLWKEIPNILSQGDASIKPQFDMMVAMAQQQTGIDIEQDLLAHLGSH